MGAKQGRNTREYSDSSQVILWQNKTEDYNDIRKNDYNFAISKKAIVNDLGSPASFQIPVLAHTISILTANYLI